MMTLGIPSFRLEKDVIRAEIDVLRQMGVELRTGVEVGRDISLQALREEGYKAFYIAIGAQRSAPVGIPGEDLTGVVGALEFLRRVNLGEKVELPAQVAVIGGGNVALDAARTARGWSGGNGALPPQPGGDARRPGGDPAGHGTRESGSCSCALPGRSRGKTAVYKPSARRSSIPAASRRYAGRTLRHRGI